MVFFAEAGAIHYGGASSANAPVRFYWSCTAPPGNIGKSIGAGPAQLGFLAAFAIHHSIRLLACAFIYLFSPSRRAHATARFKRSLACLQWVGAAKFRQFETSKKTAQVQSA